MTPEPPNELPRVYPAQEKDTPTTYHITEEEIDRWCIAHRYIPRRIVDTLRVAAVICHSRHDEATQPQDERQITVHRPEGNFEVFITSVSPPRALLMLEYLVQSSSTSP